MIGKVVIRTAPWNTTWKTWDGKLCWHCLAPLSRHDKQLRCPVLTPAPTPRPAHEERT